MSKHYETVKSFYENKTWSLNWVQDAVDRWITVFEFQQITGEKYVKKSGVK
jgi:hypothetical protein